MFAAIPRQMASSRRDRAPIDVPLHDMKVAIERGRRLIHSGTMTISPSVASYLLTLNPENRPTKKYVISGVMEAIEEGRFELNGETIIIADDGFVNDGQNRLIAIERSGMTVQSVMVFGVPRETRMTVDSMQAARTTSDYLTMRGVESEHRDVGNVGAYLWLHEQHGHINARSPAPTVTNEYCIDNLDEIQQALAAINKPAARELLNVQGIATLYILFKRKAGLDDARFFIERLLSGANLDGDSPIHVLRARLTRDKRTKSAGRKQINNMMQLCVRAWNHHRDGQTLSRLLVGERWPEISR
jgi:hypothetical protein